MSDDIILANAELIVLLCVSFRLLYIERGASLIFTMDAQGSLAQRLNWFAHALSLLSCLTYCGDVFVTASPRLLATARGCPGEGPCANLLLRARSASINNYR
jgi:hypothetical protein